MDLFYVCNIIYNRFFFCWEYLSEISVFANPHNIHLIARDAFFFLIPFFVDNYVFLLIHTISKLFISEDLIGVNLIHFYKTK
jgi:hypothetical protein